jgi:hypothetical protein
MDQRNAPAQNTCGTRRASAVSNGELTHSIRRSLHQAEIH